MSSTANTNTTLVHATGCDVYCPHHNSAHTHTHQPLDLAYSLPQHTWHPLIITVSCCRALMINLCSFLGLSWDVLNTMISLASVLSDLISEVFDHTSNTHSYCSRRLRHERILTGLDTQPPLTRWIWTIPIICLYQVHLESEAVRHAMPCPLWPHVWT